MDREKLETLKKIADWHKAKHWVEREREDCIIDRSLGFHSYYVEHLEAAKLLEEVIKELEHA